MKIIFTCGGTAGHINPAIGAAGRIRELVPEAEILFVGAEGMMETELVPREGYQIETVKISNISRSLSIAGLKHNINTMKNIVNSTQKAKKLIRDFKPDVVVGTGGYVCYPVLKAAHSLGIPTMVHESNAVPGLTTKMLSGIVDCIMVGFEEAKKNYSGRAGVVFTGTPVRTDFLKKTTSAAAKARLGIAEDKPLVLSVWGSLGSDHMNGIMEDFIPLAAKDQSFSMIHSAGKRGYRKLKNALEDRCGKKETPYVDVREYIYDMPLVMAAADLILCRSGASTLAELASLGKPAVLIPSPNVTNHHQEKNARMLVDKGAAKLALEGEFTAESLYGMVRGLLGDAEALSSMGDAMKKLALSDSTDRIAALILEYACNS